MTNRELKDLLLILRKNGVLSFEHEGLKLAFSPDAMKLDKPKEVDETVPADKWSNFPVGNLTDEQLAFYSAGGDPSDDPERDA